MQTNAVDLRRNMKDIMRAVDRHEPVTVLYHGKEKAIIRAIDYPVDIKVKEHPFFAMSDDDTAVKNIMDSLRGDRF